MVLGCPATWRIRNGGIHLPFAARRLGVVLQEAEIPAKVFSARETLGFFLFLRLCGHAGDAQTTVVVRRCELQAIGVLGEIARRVR